MRVTKIYDDGRLVSCKKTGESTNTQVDSRCFTALRKEVTYEVNSFILNVTALQKELSRTKRLLNSRTSERNSARRAHRKRLQQVYVLKSAIEDLKLESLIQKEDLDGLQKNSFVRVQAIGDEKKPCSGREYEVDFPDGTKVNGRLDAEASKAEETSSDYTFGVKAKAIKRG